MFVSGPTIAALTQTPRMTINDRLRAGSFGPTSKCGRIVYVVLENVEKATGLKFSEQQIEAASADAARSRRHNQTRQVVTKADRTREAITKLEGRIAELKKERDAALLSSDGTAEIAAIDDRMRFTLGLGFAQLKPVV